MKKNLFSFLLLTLFTSATFAACPATPVTPTTCNKDNNESIINKIDDDEYFEYNQCFFDKHFKQMKKALCLSKKQEPKIDTIYKNFKNDMEIEFAKYRIEKNKLLKMIECDEQCYKNQLAVLKDIKKDICEKCKEYKEEIKEVLCKEQYSDFNKFQKSEKAKMKKLIKYSAIHKFPCENCD